MNYEELCKDVGRLVLFVGNECQGWQAHDFAQAANFAAAVGVDSLVCKVADGTIVWHDPASVHAVIRPAVVGAGRGFIPFTYCYGPRFGDNQIAGECAQLVAYAEANDGSVCADMEQEWNGQGSAAATFAREVSGKVPGLILSTWADPDQQDWAVVLDELKGVATAWGPQQYTNWLGSVEGQYTGRGYTNLMPELDLTGEFGPNDPIALTRQAIARGHGSVWLWEYLPALRNAQLVKAISALLHDTPPPPPPPGSSDYQIESGDTLWAIAAHNNTSVAELLSLNEGELDAVAREHGYPNSNGGSRIWPGTVIRLR